MELRFPAAQGVMRLMRSLAVHARSFRPDAGLLGAAATATAAWSAATAVAVNTGSPSLPPASIFCSAASAPAGLEVAMAPPPYSALHLRIDWRGKRLLGAIA
jgi:hypothetical protein